MSRFCYRIAVSLMAAGVLVACDSGGSGMSGDESNQKPSVTISAPEDEAEFAQTDTIAFEGSAEDPETGALTGSSLIWKSSTDGRFGEGRRAATPALSPDVHTITLAATDSLGETARDTVSVSVNGPPAVSITDPSAPSAADEGAVIAFEGSATDPVDGELSGSALEWSSSVDGPLGTGENVSSSSLAPGPHTITLTATDQDGEVKSDSIDIVVEQEGFNVRFQFLSDLTSSEKTTVREAVAPWESAITGDLAPFILPQEAVSEVGFTERGVDDLVIAVRVLGIDGDGGTLARAAPVVARTDGSNFTTSSAGIVQIDEADLDNSQLQEIITHEIGHVLGIGTTWDAVTDVNTVDPVHEGSNTTTAFQSFEQSDAYLGEGVPLERFGGAGTALGHWAENNFDNELMTGAINTNSENPLSRVSLAALADIGYPIDLQAADPYKLPATQWTLLPAGADATLSRPASAEENFGTPKGGQLDSVLVAGANNDQLWSSEDPEDEVFSGLVRFNTPSSLPMGVSVTGAELALRGADTNSETPDHDVGVYLVGGSWSETDVTAKNQPSRQDSITAFDFQSCDPLCGQDGIDVTAPVRDWVTGSDNHGFLLRAPDASSTPTFSVGFRNRHIQRSSLLRPFLVVFTEASAGAAARPGISLGDPDKLSSDASPPGKTIPLGDDILNVTVYGIDSAGDVVKTKRLR
jgi:hypothetical protein